MIRSMSKAAQFGQPFLFEGGLVILRMSNNTPEQNFTALGLSLPPAPTPMGVYKPCLIDGKYLYVSGHGPFREDKSLIVGRIGQDMDIETGKLAARQTGLSILSTIKNNLGSLDKVKRVIKVLGMVGCTPEFDKHPYAINGCSELFVQVWAKDNGVGFATRWVMGRLPGIIRLGYQVWLEFS